MGELLKFNFITFHSFSSLSGGELDLLVSVPGQPVNSNITSFNKLARILLTFLLFYFFKYILALDIFLSIRIRIQEDKMLQIH